MVLYSPFGMPETQRIHPWKCGDGQEGGQEGGEEERETKSYAADRHRT